MFQTSCRGTVSTMTTFAKFKFPQQSQFNTKLTQFINSTISTQSRRQFTTTTLYKSQQFPSIRSSLLLTTATPKYNTQFTPSLSQQYPNVIYAPRRNMSIGSYFTDKIEGKKMEMQQHKERESFRHLRDYIISCPKFRFKEQLAYYEALQAKVGKTDRLIGGQDVKQQEEVMKKKIDMFRAMTPLEQLYESPGALNMTAKSRISVATGLDRKTIDTDLKQFDEMKTMHTWMQRRLKNGKTIPEDSIEMQKLMVEDPPPPSYAQIKMMQKAKTNARRGQR